MKKWLVLVAIVALLVAHQDYWQWSRADLVFGFVPYNMAYHIVVSLVTALVWILVCAFCWPDNLESRVMDSQPGGDEE
jgi:hypothetical protein